MKAGITDLVNHKQNQSAITDLLTVEVKVQGTVEVTHMSRCRISDSSSQLGKMTHQSTPSINKRS